MEEQRPGRVPPPSAAALPSSGYTWHSQQGGMAKRLSGCPSAGRRGSGLICWVRHSGTRYLPHGTAERRGQKQSTGRARGAGSVPLPQPCRQPSFGDVGMPVRFPRGSGSGSGRSRTARGPQSRQRDAVPAAPVPGANRSTWWARRRFWLVEWTPVTPPALRSGTGSAAALSSQQSGRRGGQRELRYRRVGLGWALFCHAPLLAHFFPGKGRVESALPRP